MAKKKAAAKKRSRIRSKPAPEPKTPRMEHASSTAIRGIGHTRDTLDIEFRAGSKYRYHGVSKGSATRLKNASSIGRHFVKNIRNNYSFTKLRAASSRGRRKGKR